MFDDCKKNVTDAFLSFDLHWITPTGEPKEDEEEDEGEKPAHVIDGDGVGEEVVEVPMPEVPEVVEAPTEVPPVSVAIS